MVEIVKHCAFGVPPIIIGHHLDKVMKSDFEKQICVKEGEEGLLERLSSPKWSIEETAWSIYYEYYTYTMDTMLIKVQQQCRHFDYVLCDDN